MVLLVRMVELDELVEALLGVRLAALEVEDFVGRRVGVGGPAGGVMDGGVGSTGKPW
jgi:hypothetical protein